MAWVTYKNKLKNNKMHINLEYIIYTIQKPNSHSVFLYKIYIAFNCMALYYSIYGNFLLFIQAYMKGRYSIKKNESG